MTIGERRVLTILLRCASPFHVIPAKAGIQGGGRAIDTRLRGYDDEGAGMRFEGGYDGFEGGHSEGD